MLNRASAERRVNTNTPDSNPRVHAIAITALTQSCNFLVSGSLYKLSNCFVHEYLSENHNMNMGEMLFTNRVTLA